MADRVLRWGLLSTARINRALIPPLRASERNGLSAVASRSLEAAQAYATEWSIPRALGSYEALIDDPEIDVIYNPLPNHLHADWTVRAVKAGKHVLCEKPLALTIEEVDRIAEAARETGKIAAEAFMYRHHPQTLKVKELIDGGAIGRLLLVRGAFTFTLTNPGDYRLSPEMGGGSIWDVGCYPISYARALAGSEPLEVFGWQTSGPTGIDESFTGQLRFADGVRAQFDCGFNAPYRTWLEVVGTEGVINVPVPFKPGPMEQIVLTRGGQAESVDVSGPELYVGEVEDLADAVLLGKTPRVSLADSRGNVAAILALLESARVGKPVLLE